MATNSADGGPAYETHIGDMNTQRYIGGDGVEIDVSELTGTAAGRIVEVATAESVGVAVFTITRPSRQLLGSMGRLLAGIPRGVPQISIRFVGAGGTASNKASFADVWWPGLTTEAIVNPQAAAEALREGGVGQQNPNIALVAELVRLARNQWLQNNKTTLQ